MEDILKSVQEIYDRIQEAEDYNYEESWRVGNEYYHGYGEACSDVLIDLWALKKKIVEKINKEKKEEKND